MKKISVLIFTLTLVTNAQSQNTNSDADLKKIEWLCATWDRTDMKGGKISNERWVRTMQGDLQGWGVTMSGSDTVFVEKLRIVSREGSLFYVADVPENNGVVHFKFTELSDNAFACENPNHDFPKKIEYRKDGKLLIATISGNGKSFTYRFQLR